MNKKEAIYCMPKDDGKWLIFDLSTGNLVADNEFLDMEFFRCCADDYRTIFIPEAYQVLATSGLLDLRGHKNVDYIRLADDFPFVIMQDPPTMCGYRFSTGTILVLDPANYGIRTDVKSPVQQLMHYRHVLGLNEWPTCAASAACQSGMNAAAIDVRPQEWQHVLERGLLSAAPMGGNCGAGWYGVCPGNAFHHYDLEGAYLSAAESFLPTRVIDEGDGNFPYNISYDIVADVDVETDTPSYPYRPSTEFSDGRRLTIYPVGRFRTVLCGEELRDAMARHRVMKVHRWQRWSTTDFLGQYSRIMRSIIRSCHPSVRPAVKTTALAGLGWLARKEKRWVVSTQNPPKHDFCGDFYVLDVCGVVKYRVVAGTVCREVNGGYHCEASPQVWAWIAAQVRSRLANVLRLLGKHALYWDTDSVITNSVGAKIMESLPDFDVAGGWRKKGVASKLIVSGYRRYVFGDQLHVGLPESSRDEAGGRYVWESPETWDEAMGQRKMPDGTIVTRAMRIKGKYDHGRICDDGRILPWSIHAGKVMES